MFDKVSVDLVWLVLGPLSEPCFSMKRLGTECYAFVRNKEFNCFFLQFEGLAKSIQFLLDNWYRYVGQNYMKNLWAVVAAL